MPARHAFWHSTRSISSRSLLHESACKNDNRQATRLGDCLERETGFEPATSTLARLHSTTELLPQAPFQVVERGALSLSWWALYTDYFDRSSSDIFHLFLNDFKYLQPLAG